MRVAESPIEDRLARLTRRERECLELVARHWRTKEIARQLDLAPDTVDEYVRSAVRKLGAPDRAAAARIWLADGGAPAPLSEAPSASRSQAGWSLGRTVWGALGPAAKVAMLVGGATGGVVALLAGIAESGAAFPALAELNRGVGAALWAVAPPRRLGLLAFGPLAERLAGAIGLTAFALTVSLNRAPGPDIGVILTDLGMAMALGAVAFGFRRPWLQAAAGMSFLAVLTHFAYYVLLDRQLSLMAYATVLNLWAYLATGAMVWSSVVQRRRWKVGVARA